MLQLWVYACIQRMHFLESRIRKHPFYSDALKILRTGHGQRFIVRGSLPVSQLELHIAILRTLDYIFGSCTFLPHKSLINE
jgi:hypothetical protein